MRISKLSNNEISIVTESFEELTKTDKISTFLRSNILFKIQDKRDEIYLIESSISEN